MFPLLLKFVGYVREDLGVYIKNFSEIPRDETLPKLLKNGKIENFRARSPGEIWLKFLGYTP